MHAVLESGGKQFRVAVGDTIRVDTLEGAVGSSVELDKVLAILDNGSIAVGSQAASAKVKATITEHDRGEKVIVFKFKRKKQYKKTIGHRQNYTAIRIDEIVA